MPRCPGRGQMGVWVRPRRPGGVLGDEANVSGGEDAAAFWERRDKMMRDAVCLVMRRVGAMFAVPVLVSLTLVVCMCIYMFGVDGV